MRRGISRRKWIPGLSADRGKVERIQKGQFLKRLKSWERRGNCGREDVCEGY